MDERPRCAVCLRRATVSTLCLPCFKSYQETDGCDMFSVIVWAVNRARYFDARKTPPTPSSKEE